MENNNNQDNKYEVQKSMLKQQSNGEFSQEDIGEFHPSNINSIVKQQQNMDDLRKSMQNGEITKINDNQNYFNQFSESLEDIQVLEEYEKVDENKKLPRVSGYKTIQSGALGRVIDFVSYQFPEIFLQQTEFFMRERLGGISYRKKNRKQNNDNEDDDEEDEDDDDIEAEQKVIVDVVENLLILANPQEQVTPKTEKYIKRISKELDDEGQKYFEEQLSRKNLDFKEEEEEVVAHNQNCILTNRNDEMTSIMQENQEKIIQQDLNNRFEQIENGVKKSGQNFLKYLQQVYLQWEKNLPSSVDVSDDVIFIYQKDEINYSQMSKNDLDNFQKNLQMKKIDYDPKDKKQKDKDPRHESAYKEGGKMCMEPKQIKILRDIGSYMIKKIGRQLLSGDFDLTKLSFPIKVMVPMSGLEKALNSTCLFPTYITRAAKLQNDPVERMKLVITASLGHFFVNLSFLKPLNPILGETIEGKYPDGTQLYAEQISHHPPITYFTVYGPENSYRFNGYYNYKSNAGLNSLTLKNSGTRSIKFKDGQQIDYNFGKEKYTGSFWGTMRTECEGKVTFQDKINGIQATIEFGNVKSRPNDYFSGFIMKMDPEDLNNLNDKKKANKVNTKLGEKISEIYGSYMGFIDFDGVRYWDQSNTTAFKTQILASGLESDQVYRPDKAYLKRGHIAQAQIEKEKLEQLQRHDAALRKQNEKERVKQEKQEKKEEKKREKGKK